MRTKCEYRSCNKENYISFCKNNPSIDITYDKWKIIIYGFNESFREYILETGDKAKLPFGLGEFSINKKKRKNLKIDKEGREFVNLPVDWKKTKEKGKIIYNFNYNTEGYFFGWVWFRDTARFKNANLWYFKACRNTSRLLAHYIKSDDNYQHIYREWGPHTQQSKSAYV